MMPQPMSLSQRIRRARQPLTGPVPLFPERPQEILWMRQWATLKCGVVAGKIFIPLPRPLQASCWTQALEKNSVIKILWLY